MDDGVNLPMEWLCQGSNVLRVQDYLVYLAVRILVCILQVPLV